MSLRFQRLVLILITLLMLGSALLLILFNTKQNIVFFYTPTELLESEINLKTKIRIGGFVKEKTFKKNSKGTIFFVITDNLNNILVEYNGILPDLFREGQGTVVEGFLIKKNKMNASKVFAKHDENYMPASIKKQLMQKNYWRKNY